MWPSKVLVCGATGQVGSQICRLLGDHVIGISSKDIDFTEPDKLAAKLAEFEVGAIINAAAYTKVDKAEEEESTAHLINGEAPKILAAFAKTKDIPLIHFSTDYVFNGEGERPWKEGDNAGPINAYGRTKLEGEKGIEEVGGKYLIFRTSWVYNERGHNFVNTMLRLGKEKEVISVVEDQIGAPTYAWDIAGSVLKILEFSLAQDNFPRGIYHMCNSGKTSWFDFAEEILKIADAKGIELEVKEVKPMKTADYKTAAKRPVNSRLDCSKLRDSFGIVMPDWKDSLKKCMGKIN